MVKEEFTFTKIDWKNMLMDCIVVDMQDVYLYFNWKDNAWQDCIQVEPKDFSVVGNLCSIRPVYKTMSNGMKKIVKLVIEPRKHT